MENTTPKSNLNITFTDGFLVLLWVVILYITRLFMQGADPYLAMTPEALGKYFNVRYALIAHITAGGGALLLGFLQFVPRLMAFRKLHRIIGTLYLLAILVSSVCAVVLAFTSAYVINWPYAFSLQVWVGVWITTTIIAYRAALQRKFTIHKQWMIRSYIVTLAFIISGLLLKLPIVQQLGSFDAISPTFFWTGWSVPLFVYEVYNVFFGTAPKSPKKP